jgi:pimeloyl-ACP methyl ester carboxylesterase
VDDSKPSEARFRRWKRNRPDGPAGSGPDHQDADDQVGLFSPADPNDEPDKVPIPDGSVVRDEGPWTHRDVSANGIRFHIVEAGTGPLVILLHGFGQYWRAWRYQLPGLAQAGFRVVAPDLRGYGDTDKTQRGYDAFTLADDVAGLVRGLGERDAVLVGHGYGGVTAFNTAVMKPGQVRGVVAIAAPHPIRMARIRRPVPSDRYGRLLTWAGTPAWPERHLLAGNAALLERIVRSQSGPVWKASTDFTETMAKMRQAIRIPGAARGAVEHLRWVARSPWRTDGHRHREALAAPITAPVLHIVGDADRFTPPSSLIDAREQCSGWYTLSTVRGVGHYPAEESPDLVTRMIAELAKRAQPD